MYYQINEGYLTLDGPWQDQSINVLVPRDSPVKGLNIVVSRDLLPTGSDAASYLDAQRQNFKKELPQYRLLSEGPDTLDERAAHFFEFTWSSEEKPMHQMMIVVEIEGRILSLTTTVPGKIDEKLRAQILTTMKSFRFGPVPAETKDRAP